MKLYTNYFAYMRHVIAVDNVTFVSIARKTPDSVSCLSYDKLAPSWDILREYKETGDIGHYTKRYKEEILDKLNVYEVMEELRLFNRDGEIHLLCYETPDKFCHRSLVRQWLKDEGYFVEEYKWRSV